jgi:hypothetical protein
MLHSFSKQDAEKVPQLRSRLIEILNVPQGYASGFESPAALLDELFEHPAGSCLVVPNMRTVEFPAGPASLFLNLLVA